MSLFRLREWWSTSIDSVTQIVGPEDPNDKAADTRTILYGQKSMASGSLLHVDTHQDQLVVGSYSGVINVFNPSFNANPEDQNQATVENDINYKAEHLLLEEQLTAPIIQLACGKFSTAMETDSLAVLHPRSLVVYAFRANSSDQVEHGASYTLHLLYAHQLSRTAYNMACGSFGGVTGRDFICVQSLDATLSMYEHETFAFSRFLPGSLLPGPLHYAPMSDNFITVSSSYVIQSYKYQVLAVAVDSSSKEEATNMATGKRVLPDWTYDIGEAAVDLAVIEMSPAQPSLLILGERHVFCLTEGGTMRFIKKLDYNTLCMHAYASTSEGYIQWLIATDTNTLMFYADATLRWTVQLPFKPAALMRTVLSNALRGFISILSPHGAVTIGYLGTDPSLFGLPRTENRNVDFVQRQVELKRLQAAIANANQPEIRQATANQPVRFTAVVPPALDQISVMAYGTELPDDQSIPSITVQLNINAQSPINSVQVFVCPTPPIVAHQNAFSFATVQSSEQVPVTFFLRGSSVPSSLLVRCRLTHDALAGGPGQRLMWTDFDLPLSLVAKSVEPNKMATHKITLECSLPALPMNQLFADFQSHNQSNENSEPESVKNTIALQLVSNETCTGCVMSSSNTMKYRVQSDTVEWLWLLLHELLIRLEQHSKTSGQEHKLTYAGTLPLQEYFALLDAHFELHKRYEKLQSVLGNRCAQLLAVQRQLLTKFKHTSSTPLVHLDGLLEMSHRQVMSVANSVHELQTHLRSRSAGIACATKLLLSLLKLSTKMDNEEYQRLEHAFSPIIDEYPDQTWEQRTEAAISHLLQIMSRGHTSVSPANSQLPKMSDATKLKRHVQLLCEKLTAGQHMPLPEQNNRPTTAAAGGGGNDKVSKPTPGGGLTPIMEDTTTTDTTKHALGEVHVPEGSTFGLSTSIPPPTIIEEPEPEEAE